MCKKIGITITLSFILFLITGISGTIEVTVTGLGETVEIAVDSGLKQAIELAVGALIRGYSEMDSSLTVTATDIIEETKFQEKILSFSKAYIQHYEILRTTEKSGLWYVDLFCKVKQSALESTMLRNGIGVTHFSGSALLNIYERNQLTDVNAGRMVTAVFEDFSVPHGLWRVKEVKTEIAGTTAQEVELWVSVVLTPDSDKYRGFLSELEEVLKVVREKESIESVKADKQDNWRSMLLSSFFYDPKYRDVIRIFNAEKPNEMVFHNYYFLAEEPMGAEIFEALKALYQKKSSYSLQVTFFDVFQVAIHQKDHIRVTQSGMLLNNNTFGFSYSSQKGNQFYLLPGSFRSEPGKLKLSVQDLTLSFEMKMPKEVFGAATQLIVEIVKE